MKMFKEQLTQEEIQYLEVGLFTALQIKVQLHTNRKILAIIDKINWDNNPNTLKYLYFLMTLNSTDDIELRNEIVKRLTDLVGVDEINNYDKKMREKLENYSDGIMFVYD